MPELETTTEKTQAAAQVTPLAIFQTLQRYQQALALKGAIDLDLFAHIGAGATSVPGLAAACEASPKGVRVLCDYMTILGFLRKSDGHYALTAESSVFLDRKSPAYLGSIAGFVASPEMIQNFSDVAALVRKGGALGEDSVAVPESDRWVLFARLMAPLVHTPAQAVAEIVSQPGRAMKVLDIAAGHGLFGIAVGRRNPAAAIVALDWRNVLEVALANAKRAGIEARFRTIPGNAFEVELGTEYDLVLIPNFLHHFDPATNTAFLGRVRAAMNPGGCVALVEFVPDEDRVSPPPAAAFSLVMLANTHHGDAYTFREYTAMLADAGFSGAARHDLEPAPFTLVLAQA